MIPWTHNYCFVHPIFSSFGFWYFVHSSCVVFFPVFFCLVHLALQNVNKDYIIFLYFHNFVAKSDQKPKTKNGMNETELDWLTSLKLLSQIESIIITVFTFVPFIKWQFLSLKMIRSQQKFILNLMLSFYKENTVVIIVSAWSQNSQSEAVESVKSLFHL